MIFFKNAFFDANKLNDIESCTKIEYEKNDYRNFVTRVIQKNIDPLEFHESREEKEYIDDFLQALAICQSVSLQYREDGTINSKNLQQKIDCIL